MSSTKHQSSTMKTTSVIFLLIAAAYAFPGHEHEPRIVGGVRVKKHSLSHTVQIRDEDNDDVTKSCLGSIVDKEWVLTSAQCVIEKDPENIVVVPNQLSQTPNHWQLQHKPDAIHIHNQFDKNTGKNDVALLHLSTPIHFTDTVRPVQLGKLDEAKEVQLQVIKLNEEPERGLKCGRPSSSSPSSLSLTLTSLDSCARALNNGDNLDEKTQLCVKSFVSKGSSLCGLPSGAPLIDEETGKQVGVVGGVGGHTRQCDDDPLNDDPLLCTKVEAVKDFLTDTTKIPQ